MWLKQCHKRTIPQENHHEFIGSMFTYHSQEVMGGKNDIVLPIAHIIVDDHPTYPAEKKQVDITCFTYLGSAG